MKVKQLIHFNIYTFTTMRCLLEKGILVQFLQKPSAVNLSAALRTKTKGLTWNYFSDRFPDPNENHQKISCYLYIRCRQSDEQKEAQLAD